MDLEPDFKEFLELFNRNGVRYLIVGGYALQALNSNASESGAILSP